MKPNRVRNPDVGKKMKPTNVANLNAFVKMKHFEWKMKPIRVRNLDTGVKMNEARPKMKPIEQILVDGFHF